MRLRAPLLIPALLVSITGGGIGGYSHDGRAEFTPLFSAGMSVLFHRFYFRIAGTGVLKTKYFRDVDSSISLTLGYRLGNRKPIGKK